MANILQVSNIPIQPNMPEQTGVGPSGIQNRQAIPEQSPIKTPGEQQQTGNPEVLFGSNYAAFVRLMQDSADLPDEMRQILAEAGQIGAYQGEEELSQLLSDLVGTVTQGSPDEITGFLEQQAAAQAKFSGPLFDAIRRTLDQNPGGTFSADALRFLKSYNDFSSGGHLLSQMETIGNDLKGLVSKSAQAGLENIFQQINWHAGNGDTESNSGVINNRLIPFLAEYIARTHDYGPVRSASVLLSLYASRYENGSLARLEKTFAALRFHSDFREQLPGTASGDPDKILDDAVSSLREKQDRAGTLPELMGKLLQKGVLKENGTAGTNPYSAVTKSMLANESVYMPLLHMMVPFRYQNTDTVAEMWVDPDERRKGGPEEAGARLFLKFSIQGVGDFEMTARWKQQDVEMQLFIPSSVTERPETVAGAVTKIVEKNGLHLTGLSVAPKQRSLALNDVFPEIREMGKGVNVRI